MITNTDKQKKKTDDFIQVLTILNRSKKQIRVNLSR